MASPVEAIKNVFVLVFGQKDADNTALKDIPDFDELKSSDIKLSQGEMEALKEGRKQAADDQKEFEKVVAKKSQPAIIPDARTRIQAPSKSDIVKGEAVEKDKDDDSEPERTIGPKY